jgi:hypothetical protein
MITQIEKNLAKKPGKVSSDAGYFSEANVTDAAVAKIDLYIATGRDKLRGEWRLVCAVSNLLKLFRFGWMLQTA